MAEVSRPASGDIGSSRTSDFSSGNFSMHLDSSQGPRLSATSGGQRQTEMKLLAMEPDLGLPAERSKDYKGRIRTWPGLLLLLLMISGALAVIVLQAKETSDAIKVNRENYEQRLNDKRKIKDGKDDDQTMDKMFGYLIEKTPNTAMVMGEFAGLYSKDAHPLKTTKRTTDYTIEVMLKAGYAGAYMWSLNPESAYQYNPADTYGTFTEGLLEDDWLTPNKEFVTGIGALDVMENLQRFPCFAQEVASSSSG
ncbi:uncharacterized protein KRP23_13638 [Phytophthora ramorum]|uniref:uncharacterized protein n=1 Tax=Phytophthora ramorum TaxID=164328 RepID=UPI00309522BB|nr:hypothetical protein KRP23_13638 [Phytophthora ramorum]